MKNKNLVISIYGFNIESLKPDENNPKLIRGEKLFQNIDIKAYEGEIVLLLGASGTGKSLLTNILLGFIPLWERGIIITPNTSTSHFKVILDNKEIEILQPIYPQELEGKIGIMFQTLGLFDDLTVEENLAFANDQSSSPKKGNEWKAWRKEILNTLNLPSIILNSDVTKLSGGQKQRVAFGRILAFNPKIIIFDEPTSALDYNSTQQVVSLIKKTHKENKNLLTLVITHDYENFIKIADRVWFINSNQQIENHSPPKSSNYYKREIAKERKPTNREISTEEYIEHEIKCKDIWWNTLIKRFFISLKKSILLKSYYWFFKFFWVMFKLLVIRSIPYNLITGFFLGLVATYFSLNLNLGSISLSSGEQVKIENFIVPAFFQEMLSGFGIVMFRALIPLFTCIFIAARSGTAVTAYISNMKDKERRQWDAMKNLGIDPLFFFFPQILICFMFGAWFLSYISFLVSALGSLLVALTTNYLCTWYTWVNTFWVHLHPKPLFGIFKFIPIFDGFGMFTLKTLCSGMAIAIISFAWGVKQRKSSMDTLKHLIGANICNISAILLIFFIILIYEMG